MNLLARTVRQPSFELSPIKAMELAAARIPDCISLAQGIPSLPAPEFVHDYAIEMVRAGKCDRYSLTNGLTELREEIALAMADEGLRYDPDSEIIVTCGSIEGITASLLALTQPGSEVIIPSPTYASYLGAISIAKCTPKYVELDEENNFAFHIDRMERAINSRTGAILFCSPNNPTGTLFPEENTRRIVDLALKHNIPLIVDEVYKDFYYADEEHFSPTLIPDARNKIVRVCSFSKAYAMTGWRVGFLLANQNTVSHILKFHDAMVTCAPVVSQYAAIAALKMGPEFLRETRDIYKKRRDYSIERLDALSQVFDYQIPNATYFVFPRIKDSVKFSRDSHSLAYDLLEKARVATVPGIAFGPSGESHLRINFGREMDVLEQGFDRLEKHFQTPHGRKAPIKKNVSSGSADKEKTLSLRMIERWLAFCARTYIDRNRPQIIGIAGARGKTVFKRTLTSLLSESTSVRSNFLSYNTEIGLPLSVLQIESPRTFQEKARLPFTALWRAITRSEDLKFLILEYGMRDTIDAHALLETTAPDWLILTPISLACTPREADSLLEAVLCLTKDIPSERILWSKDDPHLSSLELPQTGAYSEEELTRGILQTDFDEATEIPVCRDVVGQSSKLALIATVRIAALIGIAGTSVRSWLADNS